MAHPGTITSLKYLNRQNNKPTYDVIETYYREVIESYGEFCTYFKHDANLIQSPKNEFVNNVYGEKSTMSYWTSGDLMIYVELNNDNIIMNKFGIETDADGVCFIVEEDFKHAFRDKFGTPVDADITVNVYGELNNFEGILTANVITTDLTGYVSQTYTIDDLNLELDTDHYTVIANFSSAYNDIPPKHNPHLYKSPSFTPRITQGTLDGDLYGVLDLSGNGIVTGSVEGNIEYYSYDAGDNHGKNWGIAPNVGDFVRISFDETNTEEYEITRVYDRKLKYTGNNQLRERYIWRCDVVRRDPSYENVIGEELTGNRKEEQWTADRSDIALIQNETSNEIFDYDREPVNNVDLTNSDNVYGGY